MFSNSECSLHKYGGLGKRVETKRISKHRIQSVIYKKYK